MSKEDRQGYIQGICGPGESFDEPPLFDGLPEPSSAIATTTSMVGQLRKEWYSMDTKVYEQSLKSICPHGWD